MKGVAINERKLAVSRQMRGKTKDVYENSRIKGWLKRGS